MIFILTLIINIIIIIVIAVRIQNMYSFIISINYH